MKTETLPHPRVASREEWRAQRLQLLQHEKEVTKHRDRMVAERRRLPMVRIEKNYIFDGPDGKRSLRDLFDGKRQLIVYHFMFDPDSDKACPGCTGYIDGLGDLSMLQARDTNFVLISRAPFAKLEALKKKKGWKWPWYSSFGSDFNYDFHVTLDEKVCPVEYDYRSKAEMIARDVPNPTEGEEHGISVFFRLDDDVFHTYSAYARGTEGLSDSYSLLDLTPYGRQEDWEDSPAGWPQRPTYG
jgi:predicted dithiol-disulfide oxidoreductase (DUF899 family)